VALDVVVLVFVSATVKAIEDDGNGGFQ
jgi:hypothetical protein